jgi:hypothetical protein
MTSMRASASGTFGILRPCKIPTRQIAAALCPPGSSGDLQRPSANARIAVTLGLRQNDRLFQALGKEEIESDI